MSNKQTSEVSEGSSAALTPEQARKVMLLVDVERQDAEARRGRFALGGQLLAIGATSASAIFGALDMAISAGAMSVAGGAIEAMQILLMRDGMERVRSFGRKPDLSATGIGLAATCAEQGARVDAVLRELWVRLLARCLDPEYQGRVRLADIELLKTLNSSDALLLLVLGRHREKVRMEWGQHELCRICQGTGLWQAQSNSVDGITKMIPIELIRRHAAVILGSAVHVPINELVHAVQVRSSTAVVSRAEELPTLFHTDRPSACFDLFRYADDDVKGRMQTNIHYGGELVSPSGHPQRVLLEALTDVVVTPAALRVVDLLIEDREGC